MKKFLIFTLFLFACCEATINPRCEFVTISDAIPVQFWLTDCQTYNELATCGVHQKCWCAPWECDDEIRVQFTDDAVDEVEEVVSEFDSDLDSWFNTANGTDPATGGSTSDWGWSSDFGGSALVTTVNTFGTKQIRLSGVSLPQKEFTLRVKWSITNGAASTGLTLRLIIRNSSNTQLFNQFVGSGSTSTGSEQVTDFSITSSTIWQNADHFLISTSSTNYVAGDEVHVTEVSYLYEPEGFELWAIDNAGMVLHTEPFVRTPILVDVAFPSFTGGTWSNKAGNDDDWNIISTPTVATGGGGNSCIMQSSLSGYPPGKITFSYDITLNMTGTGDLIIRLYNSSGSLIATNTITGDGNLTGEFTLDCTTAPTDIEIEFFNNSGSLGEATITSFDISQYRAQTDVYNASIIPSEQDICDEQVILKIYAAGSPETEIAKSDCLDIRTNHSCTNLIQYSNTRNFAGIVYADQSPDDEFYIRVPSIFFHEQSDQETETIELVNSIISLNSDLKWKRLFEVDYVPYFFHKKLQLIFMHQFITINNKSWVQKDPYEIVEGDRRSPLKKAKVFLNEKNFVHRNVL